MGKKGKPEEGKDEKPGGLTRREFIGGAGSIAGGLIVGSALLAGACTRGPNTTPGPTSTLPPDTIISPDTLREDRIPPGQYQTNNWPVLQAGGVRRIDPPQWTFTLSGAIDNPVVLSYDEFMALPTVQVFSDMHCVTTWTRLSNLWEGPGSKTIAELARVRPEARYVIIKAPGGFSANLMMDDFMRDDVIFATGHDNKPLTAEHGAPARLVVPHLYFWKSTKWVTEVEFRVDDQPGFWERAGYHNRGDPWTEQRYQTSP
ncbi:MAG: sulfite oxidase-like oxidoreductase [Dehalococcoidaceae bacterium]|nr:sulfite oxidase-like oxidoreductase [Dehalococcoidaceae bacterium]